MKSFLQNTPILRINFPKWRDGLPSSTNDGSITLNQEEFPLLTGFASGHVRMVGDVVQYLPAVEENISIKETLQQLESNSPSPKKIKEIVSSTNHNKKPVIAEKELKTKEKLLVEKCSQNILKILRIL